MIQSHVLDDREGFVPNTYNDVARVWICLITEQEPNHKAMFNARYSHIRFTLLIMAGKLTPLICITQEEKH